MLFGILFHNKTLNKPVRGIEIPSYLYNLALSHMLVTAPLVLVLPLLKKEPERVPTMKVLRGEGGFQSKRELFQESSRAVTRDVAQTDRRWMANKLGKAFIFT